MWDMLRGREERPESIGAVEDAELLAAHAPRLVDSAAGASWYTDPGNAVDEALFALCRLRRAAGGERRAAEAGDEAVRTALARAEPEAVMWLASRVVSYMDEAGFPEQVEPWLPRG